MPLRLRTMPQRIFGLLAALVLLICSPAAAEESTSGAALPPVPVTELSARGPEPSWDTGLIAAVCGVGEPGFWQETKFCLGAMADVLWGRQQEADHALGGYAQVGSAGFRDVRFSMGAAYVQPWGDWLVTELRVGPLMRIEGHPAWGAQGSLEIGQRSFSYKSRYSLSHALLLGFDFTARNEHLPINTVFWIGIRLDAYWLTAPAMLFQL